MHTVNKYIDIIDKTWERLPARKLAYSSLLAELLMRGHKHKAARAAIMQSGVLDYAEKHSELYFHRDDVYWADKVEKSLHVI